MNKLFLIATILFSSVFLFGAKKIKTEFDPPKTSARSQNAAAGEKVVVRFEKGSTVGGHYIWKDAFDVEGQSYKYYDIAVNGEQAELVFRKGGVFKIRFYCVSREYSKDIRFIIDHTFVVADQKGRDNVVGKDDIVRNQAVSWYTSYAVAREKAKKENRRILLFFSGSDWSEASRSLEKELTESKEFGQLVDKKLILVKLDFPKGTELASGIKKQNEQLQTKFMVSRIPSVLLIKPEDETVIGSISGYGAGYLEKLKKLLNKK